MAQSDLPTLPKLTLDSVKFPTTSKTTGTVQGVGWELSRGYMGV